MRRGEVVRVELPRPAGTTGREQFGVRPAIIIQNDEVNANLSTEALAIVGHLPCTPAHGVLRS